jgi:hypothetical protein
MIEPITTDYTSTKMPLPAHYLCTTKQVVNRTSPPVKQTDLHKIIIIDSPIGCSVRAAHPIKCATFCLFSNW